MARIKEHPSYNSAKSVDGKKSQEKKSLEKSHGKKSQEIKSQEKKVTIIKD